MSTRGLRTSPLTRTFKKTLLLAQKPATQTHSSKCLLNFFVWERDSQSNDCYSQATQACAAYWQPVPRSAAHTGPASARSSQETQCQTVAAKASPAASGDGPSPADRDRRLGLGHLPFCRDHPIKISRHWLAIEPWFCRDCSSCSRARWRLLASESVGGSRGSPPRSSVSSPRCLLRAFPSPKALSASPLSCDSLARFEVDSHQLCYTIWRNNIRTARSRQPKQVSIQCPTVQCSIMPSTDLRSRI